MADQKDETRHGRDVTGKDDPARTRPYEFNAPRSQAEIVEQAYQHEDPTPSQEENDAAKLEAIFQPPGSGDPQRAEAAKKKQMEGGQSGGYQTRASTANPIPPPNPTPPKAG